MSQEENVEALKRGFAAMERGDIQRCFGFVILQESSINSNAVFDAGVYQGHEGVLDLLLAVG